MQDAQTPFSEIAKKLGMGTDTVVRRYNRLKDEGVIHYPSVIIDIEKCGFKGNAYISISITNSADTTVMYEQLSQITNVLTVVFTLGEWDLWVHAIYSDLKDLMRLNHEIAKVDGIKDIAIVSVPVDKLSKLPTIDYYSKALSNI